MTTAVMITPAGHPVRVETFDKGEKTASALMLPGDGMMQFYCHTTREIRATDLEPDDPAVLAEQEKRQITGSPT